ncbi:hypothetical protein TNCT_52831, partial [Trichonephila clavata]
MHLFDRVLLQDYLCWTTTADYRRARTTKIVPPKTKAAVSMDASILVSKDYHRPQ